MPGNPGALEGIVREHLVQVEPSYRRVRVVFGGAVVADSRSVLLLRETGALPVYYFPVGDVTPGALEPSSRRYDCPHKGVATYFHVAGGARRAEDAAWSYETVTEAASPLEGHVAFDWPSMDAWYEEDDEVFKHARDPYHRVDVLHSSRHVIVRLQGIELAESARPRLCVETAMPPRFYLPRLDVRLDLLRPSATTSVCPYKGRAVYFSADIGGTVVPDVAWSYPAPIPECPKIENLICFFNERVDLEVDGELIERPTTAWS